MPCRGLFSTKSTKSTWIQRRLIVERVNSLRRSENCFRMWRQTVLWLTHCDTTEKTKFTSIFSEYLRYRIRSGELLLMIIFVYREVVVSRHHELSQASKTPCGWCYEMWKEEGKFQKYPSEYIYLNPTLKMMITFPNPEILWGLSSSTGLKKL